MSKVEEKVELGGRRYAYVTQTEVTIYEGAAILSAHWHDGTYNSGCPSESIQTLAADARRAVASSQWGGGK